MPWETVPYSGGGGFSPLSEDEASVIESKVKTCTVFRINFHRVHVPQNVARVDLKIDREKNRIGLFIATDPNTSRRIIAYDKKGRMCYVSCSKILKEIGFSRGRYKILKKEGVKDILFYLSADKRCGDIPAAPAHESIPESTVKIGKKT